MPLHQSASASNIGGNVTSKLLDDGEVAFGSVILDQAGKISDFQNVITQIARGRVPGAGLFRKIGRNIDVDNVREDLWSEGGLYQSPPSGGIQMSVQSTSANDIAGGTGVRRIQIDYLDGAGLQKREVVNLAGITSALTLANDISHVNGISAIEEGTLNGSAGNLTLTNLAKTVTYAAIEIGSGKDRQAVFTVPAGKTAFIVETLLSGNAASGGGADYLEGFLRATCDDFGENLPTNVFNFKSGLVQTNSGVWVTQQVPIVLPQLSVVKLSVISRNASSNVLAIGGFAGWYEPVQ